jgi:hypothetical protein
MGDVIDVLSIKDIHPINYSTEHIFISLIDQKIDEAVEYYNLTGKQYDTLFSRYSNIININKKNKIS